MGNPRSERPGRKPLVALLATALLVSAALGYVAAQNDDERPAEPHRNPGPFRGNIIPPELRGKRAPAFRLPDASGRRLATADLRGRPYVLTFLYTDCPDVCPLIGQELGQSLRLLGSRRDEVSVLAVSVDPEGDTAAAARAWLRRHRLPRNFHYLIGRERELRPVWDAYFAAPQIPGRPNSTHTASIWLIDADGRIATKYSGGFPVAPADIAHDLRLLLRRRDRGGGSQSASAGSGRPKPAE